MTTENKNAGVVWRPQPTQMEFMRRPEPEALYGGAAGGGKSDALVIEALRQVPTGSRSRPRSWTVGPCSTLPPTAKRLHTAKPTILMKRAGLRPSSSSTTAEAA